MSSREEGLAVDKAVRGWRAEVLVFRNGLIAAELVGDGITVERLLSLAAGGSAQAAHEAAQQIALAA